jgi:hypothetical protein
MLNQKRTAAVVAALALVGVAPAPLALAQSQDLRTPDATDAAHGRYLGTSPSVRPQSPPVETTGFDWTSAGIGAGAGTGLIVLALALGTGGRRRTLARNG